MNPGGSTIRWTLPTLPLLSTYLTVKIMVQTISAKDVSLYDLEEQFGLKLKDDQSFTEWSSDLTTVSAP